MVVRSVHLSADSLRLAVGADSDGKGLVRLYSTNTADSLLRTWRHSKAVWVVRLSSDGALLAAAGCAGVRRVSCGAVVLCSSEVQRSMQ